MQLARQLSELNIIVQPERKRSELSKVVQLERKRAELRKAAILQAELRANRWTIPEGRNIPEE